MNVAGISFSKDPGNIGDGVCNALDYVSDFGSKRIDLRSQIEDMAGYHLVFGGGGLFHSGSLSKMDWMTRLLKRLNPNHKFICWGGGLNFHDQTAFVYPDFLREWDLVGMREWGNPYEYVPCPSCMNSAFERPWGSDCHSQVVVFEHHAAPIPLTQFPKLNSAKRKDEFLAVLMFLASGNTVITNSYHGAYWALLLGRRVVIYKPFSNRFYGLKPRVGFADESNWKQRVEESEPAPGYLAECREINFRFANKVMDCIKGKLPERQFYEVQQVPPDVSPEAARVLQEAFNAKESSEAKVIRNRIDPAHILSGEELAIAIAEEKLEKE